MNATCKQIMDLPWSLVVFFVSQLASLVTVALSGAVLTVENDARFSLCGESFLRYVLKCPSRLCAKETLSRHHAVDGYSFGQSQSESQVVGGWS